MDSLTYLLPQAQERESFFPRGILYCSRARFYTLEGPWVWVERGYPCFVPQVTFTSGSPWPWNGLNVRDSPSVADVVVVSVRRRH